MLIDEWRAELNRLWVIRVAIFETFLSIADQLLSIYETSLPPILYAVLSIIMILIRLRKQNAATPGTK